MHCLHLVGMVINTKQFTAVIYANAYVFNTALLSYFQTGHVTAMAQAPGKQLSPALCVTCGQEFSRRILVLLGLTAGASLGLTGIGHRHAATLGSALLSSSSTTQALF